MNYRVSGPERVNCADFIGMFVGASDFLSRSQRVFIFECNRIPGAPAYVFYKRVFGLPFLRPPFRGGRSGSGIWLPVPEGQVQILRTENRDS